jgi:cysteine desulfuration protein SufE
MALVVPGDVSKPDIVSMTDEIQNIQDEIISEFSLLTDWMDRYQYLIDLGKQLPELPDDKKNEANKVQGCQSQVWLIAEMKDDRLHFSGISDASIVSGLIAVLLRVYSDRYPLDIMNSKPTFIGAIGFDQHLSPTRSNGLHSMLSAIYDHARIYSATSN